VILNKNKGYIMLDQEFLKSSYKTLHTIRAFEKRCIQMYRSGYIRGYLHPYSGQEAIAVGVCKALEKDDYIASTHRGHGHCIAKGADINKMMAEICGREEGYCKGRGGSMHIADISEGNIGANGVVGSNISLGVGAALGIKIRKTNQVSVIFSSDGGTLTGAFSEGLNLAAIYNLAVILIVENNQFAVSTPIDYSSKVRDLYKKAEGYGVEGLVVDGNDIEAVYEVTKKAVEKCRSGKGPVLIEAKTYRQGGHHVNDKGDYMPKDILDHYLERDPLIIAKNKMVKAGIDEETIIAIEEKASQEVKAAYKFAKGCPEPSVEAFLEEAACQY
jgi:acetoin:2,6-dichlorophenolindophenol oxidoreductase subunit alpha